MLIIAIVSFVVAAIFGLTMLIPILRNARAPRISTVLHGVFAVVGVLLVLIAVVKPAAEGGPLTPLIIFAVAAVGGIILLAIDLSGKPIPKALAVLHPIIAAIGLILLILFVINARKMGGV